MEQQPELTKTLLELFATKATRKEYLEAVADVLQAWSGCRCIGIRVLDQYGNVPYEAFRGFDQEFWQKENCLSLTQHQCACTRVIAEAPDPQDRRALTPYGTFLSEDAPAFIDGLPEHEQQRFRGTCIRKGFRSLAIIPVRHQTRTLGAVHLADERQGLVPLERVELLESLTPLIGEAVQRFGAEQELRQAHDQLEARVEERTRELQEANERLRTEMAERQVIERKLALAAEELARSNQDLEQFAYVASHDLQEPLRTVTSYLGLLQRRYGNELDEDAREFIGFAVSGAKNMQGLIQDLLTYSRLQTKANPPKMTDIASLIERVTAAMKTTIETTQAQIQHNGLPKVMADETQLLQVFQNLISNGIKFCKERKPEIQIDAREEGSHWVFSVRDNGIGIEPRHAERVFEIFQRLHTREQYAGTGIGLAVCKKIIERHGGRIWVESEPGQGSAFLFTLAK